MRKWHTRIVGGMDLTAAANTVGLAPSSLWTLVKNGLLPKPRWQVGKRWYYTAATLAALTTAVERMRAQDKL